MRIGVFLEDWNQLHGSASSFQDSLIHGLIECKSRHQLYLFSPVPERFSDSGVTIVPIKKRYKSHAAKVFRRLKTLSLLALNRQEQTPLGRACSEHRIDVLWHLGPTGEPIINVPFIFTVWDIEHRRQPFFPEVAANRVWEARERMYSSYLPRASFILTGTQRGKDDIIQYYAVSAERVKVIPFPTPAFPFSTGGKSHDTFGVTKPYLLYPAQFWPHKNHVALLYALKVLKENHFSTYSLVFTGSEQGNLQYVREVTEKLGLSNSVHFLGFVSRQDLRNLYSDAFALVFPSLFGPDNLPPLEAFSLGCPVIAGAMCGTEEQFGDAALLVNPVDENQIAEAVIRLESNQSLRRGLVERGRLRAEKWTARDYVRAVMQIIDDFEPIRRCWDTGSG